MKKYFVTGGDSNQFTDLFMGENAIKTKLKIKNAAENENKKSFYETYLLINPNESKLYDVWSFLMLITFFVEFVLTPYTIFVGGKDLLGNGNWIYENLIDLMHTLNMIVILITQTKKGDGKVPNTRFSVIALNYVKSPFFWIDILGSWPTFFNGYQLYWLYYFKILRLADYERAS